MEANILGELYKTINLQRIPRSFGIDFSTNPSRPFENSVNRLYYRIDNDLEHRQEPHHQSSIEIHLSRRRFLPYNAIVLQKEDF